MCSMSEGKKCFDSKSISAWFPELDLKGPPPRGRAVDAYRTLYGFDCRGMIYRGGWFCSLDYHVAGHLFLPERPRGSVLLVHGFLDHTGLLSGLIRFLVRKGFCVAAVDLPGHGLSSGLRACIRDFSEYAAVVDSFYHQIQNHVPGPIFSLGHSTGCAVFLEHFRMGGSFLPEAEVFVAPLVRPAHWTLLKAGYRLAHPFVDFVPRKIRKISSDKGYLRFLKQDPLRVRRIPLCWINALQNWIVRIEGLETVSCPTLVLQPGNESIVDWRFNIAFLQRHMEDLTVRYIPGARHALLNEQERYRASAFQAIESYLLTFSHLF